MHINTTLNLKYWRKIPAEHLEYHSLGERSERSNRKKRERTNGLAKNNSQTDDLALGIVLAGLVGLFFVVFFVYFKSSKKKSLKKSKSRLL